MNILIITPSLHIGGTERQAALLANGLAANGHAVRFVTLYPGGELEKNLNVPLSSVNKAGKVDIIGALLRLRALIEDHAADVVYTFLGTPNIMGALIKPFITAKLVWGVRASQMHLSNYGMVSKLARRMEIRLSRCPDLIISNSQAGKAHSVADGFPESRVQVIPNGIDTTTFHQDTIVRSAVRASWTLTDKHWIVGLPGRVDPIKDHSTFLRAAQLVADKADDIRFTCIGGGSKETLRRLKELARSLDIEECVIWTGPEKSMAQAYNALDTVCLSSLGEGFPNVLGEAMACGVPCVSTDVGDAAYVLGDTGIVVPPGDPSALAEAILTMRDRIMTTPDLGRACRKRIKDRFALDQMVNRSERLLAHLITTR